MKYLVFGTTALIFFGLAATQLFHAISFDGSHEKSVENFLTIGLYVFMASAYLLLGIGCASICWPSKRWQR